MLASRLIRDSYLTFDYSFSYFLPLFRFIVGSLSRKLPGGWCHVNVYIKTVATWCNFKIFTLQWSRNITDHSIIFSFQDALIQIVFYISSNCLLVLVFNLTTLYQSLYVPLRVFDCNVSMEICLLALLPYVLTNIKHFATVVFRGSSFTSSEQEPILHSSQNHCNKELFWCIPHALEYWRLKTT